MFFTLENEIGKNTKKKPDSEYSHLVHSKCDLRGLHSIFVKLDRILSVFQFKRKEKQNTTGLVNLVCGIKWGHDLMKSFFFLFKLN